MDTFDTFNEFDEKLKTEAIQDEDLYKVKIFPETKEECIEEIRGSAKMRKYGEVPKSS